MNAFMMWVLGAPTERMTLIEQVLRACGQKVCYAHKNGERLPVELLKGYDETTYKIERPQLPQGTDVFAMIYVECERIEKTPPNITVHYCNQHGTMPAEHQHPPQEMLARSSVGQVLIWLANLAHDSGERPPLDWPQLEEPFIENGRENKFRSGLIGTALTGGELLCCGRWLRIPDELRFAAAASYDLCAALRGEYPGVEPEQLAQWHVQTQAAERGWSTMDVASSLVSAMAQIDKSIAKGHVVAYAPNGTVLRDEQALASDDPVVQAPYVRDIEAAAARRGKSVHYIVPFSDEKNLVVLRARPQTVSRWMAMHAQRQRTVFGNPARGLGYYFKDAE